MLSAAEPFAKFHRFVEGLPPLRHPRIVAATSPVMTTEASVCGNARPEAYWERVHSTKKDPMIRPRRIGHATFETPDLPGFYVIAKEPAIVRRALASE